MRSALAEAARALNPAVFDEEFLGLAFASRPVPRSVPDRAERHSRLRAWLDRLHASAAIAERVMRLNPDPHEGQLPRGIRRTRSARNQAVVWDMVSRGAFIRRYGRKAWLALPNGLKHKDGRRQSVAQVTAEDAVWHLYDGTAPRNIRRVFSTKRYANDPRGCPSDWMVPTVPSARAG